MNNKSSKTAVAELTKDQDEGGNDQEEEDRSLNRLPHEILLHIFNKLLDLKTLCCCSLVSKRFSSIILLVDSVSFTVPRLKPYNHQNLNPENINNLSKKFFRFFINGVVAKPLQLLRRIVAPKPLPTMISSFYGDSFRSSVYFLNEFKGVRSLHIELPSSCHGCNDDILFKWTAKFGTRIETFVFLSPTSIREKKQFTSDNGHNEEEGEEGSQLSNDLLKHRVHLAFQCLKDVIVRHRMLLLFVKEHPMLHSIAITDSNKQGSLFLREGKLGELRDWIDSVSETVKPQLKRIEVPVTVSQWYVPALQLPVSGFVMEGATLVLMEMVDRRGSDNGDDLPVIGDAFEDDDEAFSEAVMEIMVNHKSRKKTLL